MYDSATVRRHRLSHQRLAEYRDALTRIASGVRVPTSFADRNAQLRARVMAAIQARVAPARNACHLREACRPRRPRPDSSTHALTRDNAARWSPS